MSHLQQTVSQPRKKSNLAPLYLFILVNCFLSTFWELHHPSQTLFFVVFFFSFFNFPWLKQNISKVAIFPPERDILGYFPPPEYKQCDSNSYLSHTYAYIQSRQRHRKMRNLIRGDRATPQPVILISVFLSRGSSGRSLSMSYKRNFKGCGCHTVCTHTFRWV